MRALDDLTTSRLRVWMRMSLPTSRKPSKATAVNDTEPGLQPRLCRIRSRILLLQRFRYGVTHFEESRREHDLPRAIDGKPYKSFEISSLMDPPKSWFHPIKDELR